MKPARLPMAVFVAAWLGACTPAPEGPPPFYGYVEGEYVLVAAPYAGRLDDLAVERGGNVKAGDRLFALEQDQEIAAVREAEDRLGASQARLANLSTSLRPSELAALRAQADQVEASRRLSAEQLARDEALFRKGFIAQARLDDARANLARDEARLAEVRARIRLGTQSVGRPGELAAARADAAAAQAVLDQAAWRRDQKSLRAPADGRVHDTFFVKGEWVPAGKPVVSLLPPGNVKLRFFVPEKRVATLKPGSAVVAHCDGCPAPIPATVSYVSTAPEFTPPVIYSRESRAKLVFRVDATVDPAVARGLNPGQPVDVEAASR